MSGDCRMHQDSTNQMDLIPEMPPSECDQGCALSQLAIRNSEIILPSTTSTPSEAETLPIPPPRP